MTQQSAGTKTMSSRRRSARLACPREEQAGGYKRRDRKSYPRTARQPMTQPKYARAYVRLYWNGKWTSEAGVRGKHLR